MGEQTAKEDCSRSVQREESDWQNTPAHFPRQSVSAHKHSQTVQSFVTEERLDMPGNQKGGGSKIIQHFRHLLWISWEKCV